MLNPRSRQSGSPARPPKPVGENAPREPISDLPESERMQRLEALARLLDEAIRIPGTNWRLGLDSIFGLVPGAGDLAGLLLSAYILKESASLGASRSTIARMLGNLAVDFAVGAVPLLGDVFDVAFKANRRNMRLLRKHLERIQSQTKPIPVQPRAPRPHDEG